MRILLVDDSAIDTFINEKVLSFLGLVNNVQKASNGKEALEILNQCQSGIQERADIILLDLDMPVMNGFQFIEAFKLFEFPKEEKVLIIVLTSSSSPTDLDRIKSLGVKYYLTKPLNPEKVRTIILEEFNWKFRGK